MPVDPRRPESAAIDRAADILSRGGLVAFPTETVYGLGADAYSASAVARLFDVKGRPATDPVIVHVADRAGLEAVASCVPACAARLAEAFWPGPLTVVVPRSPSLPALVAAGLDSVAVRAPSHAVSQALLHATGRPIAAPSANRFGHASPTTAGHVLADLGALIDMVLDGGRTPIGVESTVVDTRGPRPQILRPGGVTMEDLRRIAPDAVLAPPTLDSEPQRSPGRMVRHYALSARLAVVGGPDEPLRLALAEASRALAAQRLRVAILIAAEDRAALEDLPASVRLSVLASLDDLTSAARHLYSRLRAIDCSGVDVVLARDFGSHGLALAIRDRLTRAAARSVIEVRPGRIDDAVAEIIASVAPTQ